MAKFVFAVVALVALLGVAEARTLQSSGELVTTEGKVVMQKAGEESLECQGCKVFVTAGEKYLEEKAPIIKAGAEKECAKLGEHAAVVRAMPPVPDATYIHPPGIFAQS